MKFEAKARTLEEQANALKAEGSDKDAEQVLKAAKSEWQQGQEYS